MNDKTLGAYVRHEKHDAPVRECPNPEVHEGGPFELAVIFRDERDEARAAAARWKEATRREVRKVHADDGLVMRAIRAAKTLSAENGILREEIKKAEQERDEARATKDMHKERADRERVRADEAEQRAAEPRPLTPDDITDEMVRRAKATYRAATNEQFPYWIALKVLRAALTVPTRPEGAEAFDPIVDAAIRGHSDITSPDVVHAISDALAEEGARAPEGSGR